MTQIHALRAPPRSNASATKTPHRTAQRSTFFSPFRRTIDRVKQLRNAVRSARPDRVGEARPEPS